MTKAEVDQSVLNLYNSLSKLSPTIKIVSVEIEEYIQQPRLSRKVVNVCTTVKSALNNATEQLSHVRVILHSFITGESKMDALKVNFLMGVIQNSIVDLNTAMETSEKNFDVVVQVVLKVPVLQKLIQQMLESSGLVVRDLKKFVVVVESINEVDYSGFLQKCDNLRGHLDGLALLLAGLQLIDADSFLGKTGKAVTDLLSSVLGVSIS